MADRLFERAFSQAAAASASDGAERPLQAKRESLQAEAGAADKVPVTPMQVSDAIQRVLQADEDKDYFRLMELPQPEADELGRPVLTVTQADISKAYRRVSVLVHPDKNPGEDARKAFEALNEAHRKLKDPGQLDEILKVAAEAAVQRREAAEASATPDERIAIQHAKAARAKELRKKETANFQAEIMRQQQQKKEATKRKRMLASKHRQKHAAEEEHSAEQANVDNSEDDDDHKPVIKRRGKPKFMF